MTAVFLPGFEAAPLAVPVPPIPAAPRVLSPGKPPAASSAPGRLEMSPTYFRARQFLHTLSPAERAAVAARSRFYSMPWLRYADDAALDELP